MERVTGRLIHPASGHISLGVLFLTVVLHRVSLGTVYTLRAQVEGVTSGLGHGLDEAAVQAVRGTRFKPATDASGAPIEWEGVVNVAFQLAG